MVVIGQLLGQFESGVVVACDDPDDGADLLENREIPVHARLSEPPFALQDLGDRHRPAALEEGVHDLATHVRVALIGPPQQDGHLVVDRRVTRGRTVSRGTGGHPFRLSGNENR